jgi:hypothetical protein
VPRRLLSAVVNSLGDVAEAAGRRSPPDTPAALVETIPAEIHQVPHRRQRPG